MTNYFAPPTVWITLLRSPVFDEVDLSSLRKGYYGASAMPVEILAEMRERLAQSAVVELLRPDGDGAAWPRRWGPTSRTPTPVSAGRPVINVETAILDDDNDPVAAGTVGEIAHRSPHLMLGYLDDRRQDRRGLPRRLVSLRRPRLLRRARPTARSGPQEGHDQDRRRERRQP